MRSLKSAMLALTCASTLAACVTGGPVRTAEHLQKYIDDNGYTAFALPRDNWGGGTVVNFNGGRENIVYFNDQCLALSGPGDTSDIRVANASLVASSYTIKRGAKIEASLAKDFAANVDINGAYNDSRVSTVKISLTSPKEYVASQGSIRARIRTLIESGNSCVDMLFHDGVFVIDRVVGVDGFSYSFETEQGQSLSLDATLLQAINLSPELSASLQGQAAMSSNAHRMLGYRLFKYTAQGGLGESEIIETRVSPQEIAGMLTPQ